MRSARATGLTLVEVAVALTLLAGVLLGLFTTLHVSSRAAAAAREHRAASDAAFLALERLMATDFEALAAAGPGEFPVPYDTGHGVVRLPPASSACFDPGSGDPTLPGHVRFVHDPHLDGADGDAALEPAAEDAPPALPELIEVQVTVAWRSLDGSDRRLDVVSRRAR